jgi:hypothetical protein
MQLVGDLADGVAEVTASDGWKILSHIEALDAANRITEFREELIVGGIYTNFEELGSERQID